MLVEDGQTVVIGGVYEFTRPQRHLEGAVPGRHAVPRQPVQEQGRAKEQGGAADLRDAEGAAGRAALISTASHAARHGAACGPVAFRAVRAAEHVETPPDRVKLAAVRIGQNRPEPDREPMDTAARRSRATAARHRPPARRLPALREALSREIVGQAALIERLLIALLADGHLLVEGAPGLAKTSAIRALAARLEADFARVQFTPGPAAGRSHRYRGLAAAGRPLRIPARADLPSHAARRRDQPRAGQGAVGAARGDGRAPGHRRPPHLSRCRRCSW